MNNAQKAIEQAKENLKNLKSLQEKVDNLIEDDIEKIMLEKYENHDCHQDPDDGCQACCDYYDYVQNKWKQTNYAIGAESLSSQPTERNMTTTETPIIAKDAQTLIGKKSKAKKEKMDFY